MKDLGRVATLFHDAESFGCATRDRVAHRMLVRFAFGESAIFVDDELPTWARIWLWSYGFDVKHKPRRWWQRQDRWVVS